MNLYEKIKTIYPELQEADFFYTIVLQDDSDGKGPYIAKWEHPTYTKPTQQELDAVQ